MKIKLEDLLSELGNPGRYQIFVFILICLNYFPLVFNHVIMAFFGVRPKHQCQSREYIYRNQSACVSSFDQVQYRYDIDGAMGSIEAEAGSCNVTYFTPSSNVSVSCEEDQNTMWIYQKTEYESSIVTEWDLVCDRTYLSSLATTVYFCGVMAGGVIFGHLADKFGRKPVMMVTLFLPVVVGVATSFAPWYSVFITLRFFQGVLMQGLQTSSYTLAMELFLPRYRSYAGAILEVFWGFGVMTVPVLAYFIPNWRHLQLAISLPSAIVFVYVCMMPESLRWLILKNRVDDAESLIYKVSDFNDCRFPQRAWDNVKLQLDNAEPDTRQYSFIDLLKTSKLRKRSLVLFYLWFAISTGYYGLTWQLTSLPGNKYLNFFIGGAVETVAYALVIPITLKFGRKKPLFTYFLLASLFMIGAGLVPVLWREVGTPWASSGLAIAGKFAMGGLFCMIFLYTSELYPTIIRNIGMGSCAFWTRLGGVVAPQIVVLNHFGGKSLPLILFGVLTLIGGFLTIMLPETLGRKLPDNIDDIELSGSQGSLETEANAEELVRLDSEPKSTSV